MDPAKNSVAFGVTGIKPRWTSSAKEGVGTAYHTSCRVWFTLSHGIVNFTIQMSISQTRATSSFSLATAKRFATRKNATLII
jgi:hypothetical protein